MEIYIIRHGETQWNRERRVQGLSDIPLNEYGIHLAKETAQGLQDLSFDRAYTSPLLRARQTAEIILGGREIPLIEDKRIQEMCFGSYEGMCISGPGKAPETEEFQKFFQDTEHFVPAKGGETVQELLKRTGDFVDWLCAASDLQEKRILVSTHGAAMTGLLNHIKGNLQIANFWINGVPANCAVAVVEVTDGVPHVVKENLIYYSEPVRNWSVGE